MTPEPKDKLDAATALVGVANGPEDAILDWRQVDWRAVEANVRRLRRRIFTASKAGDLEKVRSLQKLMLRSRANTLPRRRCPPSSGRHCAPSRGRFTPTEEGTPQGGVNTSLRLIAVQDGRCPICKDTLFAVDHRPQSPLEWEQRLATTRKTKLLCQALVFERGARPRCRQGRWSGGGVAA
jgi:hypothetical protein